MSSMHKKTIALALLTVSVSAVASSSPHKPGATVPIALQSGMATPLPAPATTLPAQPNYMARPTVTASSAVMQGIARWTSLRQSDGLPFSSYASFLTRYRGWPGETAMRRTAERAADPATSSPAEVVAFFRLLPPLTGTGHARHAFALQATGQVDAARAAARKAWLSGVLPRTDEDRLLGAFGGALLPADHDKRMEMLLDSGDTTSALRTLPYASPSRRPIYEARLALQGRAPDASSRVTALGATANADPGIILDRAKWLRDTGSSASARAFLAQPRVLATRPANVEKWYEGLLAMANGAAADRNWTTAYAIASQIDDAYPAGTDISAQSFGERDEYTSLAWLAGTTAFHRLNRPADAVGMFERYARAARSPQTQTKGLYWAGRAALAAGQAERANAYFAEASANPDQYYGQLSLERLGRSVPPPVAAALAPTPAARAAFARRELVEAVQWLGQTGQRDDQSLFVRALSEQLKSDEERLLAGELGRSIGRPDLGVWVARNARNIGDTFYARTSFPDVPMPSAYAHQWSLSHAIMRQESSFDRTAMSPVGARGMMQLMPGTARETAGKLGLSYEPSRLTSDPQYNIMLGSKYFAGLMAQYGNYAPLAIAAYNAGPGNVRKWINANGDPRLPNVDVLRWIEEIPFFETRNYVQRVLENAVVYDQLNPQRAAVPAANRLSYYLGKNRPG